MQDKIDTLLDLLEELRLNGDISYSVYSQLWDMVAELEE